MVDDGWLTSTTGTIFSKSYNDFSTDISSHFIDISKNNNDLVMDINKDDGCQYTFSSVLNSETWQHIGLVVSYEKSTVTTTVSASYLTDYF